MCEQRFALTGDKERFRYCFSSDYGDDYNNRILQHKLYKKNIKALVNAIIAFTVKIRL